MVNAEKHKRIKAQFGMLPIEDSDFMHKFADRIINDTNNNPKATLDGLNSFNDELTDYYNALSKRNVGSFFKIGTCQRILEVYEHTFVIKNTIQYNYHMLKIDGSIIKAILRTCDRVLNEFMNIQALQNKNIDRKGYGGLYSVALCDSDASNYPKDVFENIIRLETPISLGADGMMH